MFLNMPEEKENKIRAIVRKRQRRYQRVGSGLRNFGQSCYMNAALQCLVYTNAFEKYIRSADNVKNCVSESFCLLCQIHNDVPIIRNGINSTFSPGTIFNSLKIISPHLIPGRQEDANEFLLNVLTRLHENAVSKEKFWQTGTEDESAISDIFGRKFSK